MAPSPFSLQIASNLLQAIDEKDDSLLETCAQIYEDGIKRYRSDPANNNVYECFTEWYKFFPKSKRILNEFILELVR